MCGIVGYIGKNQAAPILLKGIKTLEYRGYDSCGMAVINRSNSLIVKKDKGQIDQVNNKVHFLSLSGNIGLAHTRWATHGEPSKRNAHPHTDSSGQIAVVHNGIVENYQELKKQLISEGYKFKSDTDSEVIAQLLGKHYSGNLEQAFFKVLPQIKGAYAIVAISSKEPNKVVAAKLSSPLVLGLGRDEYIIASDPSAIINYTKKIIYLDDEEVVIIDGQDFRITNLLQEKKEKKIDILEWNKNEILKNGFKHFMLKEIHEIPETIINSTRGRTILSQGLAKLGGLEAVEDKLREIERLIIVSCGTARHAGLIGEYILEEYAGIPVEVEYASEFRYRKMCLDKKTAVLVISQSGETADSLEAIREAKKKGLLTLGIVNVVDSSISRATNAGIYNHIGPEFAVASTKAFVSQVIILVLLAIFLGRQRDMSLVMGRRIIEEIAKLPKKIEKIFEQEKKIKKLAEAYNNYNNFLFIGRKYNFPIALEGALKLKEISYIHSEGYSAGEMKHGPIALIDKNFPTIAIVPKDSVYEKNISSMEEIKARGGKIISIITQLDAKAYNLSDDSITIPKTLEILTPILASVPLYLFAYYVSVSKKINPDRPRNLAKSVTVE